MKKLLSAPLCLKQIAFLYGALAVSLSASATPITYSIHQSGWSFGGEVIGTFEGEDLDHDGHIELAVGELSNYEIHFSGGWFIPEFTHTLNDLLFFDYTLGSGGFRPSFPLFSSGAGYSYDADDHVIWAGNWDNFGNIGFTEFTWTANNAIVSPIPAPASLMLVLPGLLFLGTHARSKRRAG